MKGLITIATTNEENKMKVLTLSGLEKVVDKVKSLDLKIIKVTTLPSHDIQTYPTLYGLISDDGDSYTLYEYKDSKWVKYYTSSFKELTKAEYEALSEEEKMKDIMYMVTDMDSYELYYNASNIAYDNTKSNLTSSDIQKAIDELDNNKMDKSVFFDIKNHTPHVSAIADYFNLQRTGKIYRTRIWMFNTNPSSTGEKLLDNTGLIFEPSTDTVAGRDDYLNSEHPMFEWFNCNYIRDEDGSPIPVAIEGEENYKTTGNVDVGTIQMSFYYNFEPHEDEGYIDITISDMPHTLRTDITLYPWSECVKADGTILPWCIGSKYMSGIGSDKLLRSQPNLAPERWQSHNNMITNYQKKGKGYWGAGSDRNTFQIIFNAIKGATKSSQTLFTGCSNYNYQYNASIQSDVAHTYFPVTKAQASNLIVGSSVSVGYAGIKDGALYTDRGVGSTYSYVKCARILRIEDLDETNSAVYLDIPESSAFNTIPVKLNETLTAPIMLSTLPWYSGTTDSVIGKHDGSLTSNTNGKYPYRVQGREYGQGCYITASNTVMDFQSDFSKKVYVAPKGIPHSSNDATIRSTYTMIGNVPASSDGNGSDYWIGDISIDVNSGAWYPSVQGSSDVQGCGDRCYAGGKATSGTREYLQAGGLGHGSDAGSSFLLCWRSLDAAHWSLGGCD